MDKISLLVRYVNYFLKAKDEHSLHSPFAFDFYTKIINNKTYHPDWDKIELLRKDLKKNKTQLEITDFGAGSGVSKTNTRTIASICCYSEKKPSLAQLIYRIIKDQQSYTIIDLGTSLGLTTLYESKANLLSEIFTFEGCPNTALVAKDNFNKLSATNIQVIIGNIDSTLPSLLTKLNKIDFVFFDANHRYEPTIRYFLLCLEKSTEDSIFVFDDIYWSTEMNKAWDEIKKHPSVTMTIDLFYLGIVFFRKKQPVQHFTLK